MKVPCEVVVRTVLPAIRALIAIELVEKKQMMTQQEIAKRLGITQSAISRYINRNRAFCSELIRKDPGIAAAVETLAKKIVENASSEVISRMLCSICRAIRPSDIICKLCKMDADFDFKCDLCLKTSGQDADSCALWI